MTEIRILFTGRIPCQKRLVDEKEKYGEEKLSYYYCFSPMKNLIDDADLTVGSISTVYNYPDDFIKALGDVGFDVLTVGKSNKHDNEIDALYKVLDSNTIKHPIGDDVGTTIINIKGVTIGIIECSFNDAYKNLDLLPIVSEKVNEFREERVDLIICYVSWMFLIDRELFVDERQRVIAKALANMGIDYIVGAGQPRPMKYEILKGNWNRMTPVAYSLGNLLYCSDVYNRNTSAVVSLKVKKDECGKVSLTDSYLPCYTWTVLGQHRRRVQFLNDREYKSESTNSLVEWRKLFVSRRLGDGIKLCKDYDVNKNDYEITTNPMKPLSDEFALEILSEPNNLQGKILDSYRLTEEFRESYGKIVYNDRGYSSIVKGAEHFIRSNYPEYLKGNDVKELIIDMIYTRTVLGFSYSEYFAFHLRDKSIQERTDYVSDSFRLNYYRRLNTDNTENDLLDNKWTCYERMKDLFKRDILNITDREQSKQFVEYAKKYNKFIIKPVNGTLGKGIRIIDIKDYNNLDNLFDDIFTKAGPFICEELIISRKYLADIHPQSCNSVRIFTYNNNNAVNVVCAWLKAGTGDAIVDNGGAGGIVASINKENGIVEYDAANESGSSFKVHPDSGITFKGLKIEEWESLKELAADAASRFPTVKLIAWDVAHGEKGWQIIEGNSQGHIWIYQLSTGKGMRKELEDVIGWSNSKRTRC